MYAIHNTQCLYNMLGLQQKKNSAAFTFYRKGTKLLKSKIDEKTQNIGYNFICGEENGGVTEYFGLWILSEKCLFNFLC